MSRVSRQGQCGSLLLFVAQSLSPSVNNVFHRSTVSAVPGITPLSVGSVELRSLCGSVYVVLSAQSSARHARPQPVSSFFSSSRPSSVHHAALQPFAPFFSPSRPSSIRYALLQSVTPFLSPSRLSSARHAVLQSLSPPSTPSQPCRARLTKRLRRLKGERGDGKEPLATS